MLSSNWKSFVPKLSFGVCATLIDGVTAFTEVLLFLFIRVRFVFLISFWFVFSFFRMFFELKLLLLLLFFASVGPCWEGFTFGLKVKSWEICLLIGSLFLGLITLLLELIIIYFIWFTLIVLLCCFYLQTLYLFVRLSF